MDLLAHISFGGSLPRHGVLERPQSPHRADERARKPVIAAYDPGEARDNKGEWTKGDRAATAKATYNPATYEKQLIADKSEAALAKAVGIPRTKNNSAFDLVAPGIGVEVKTLVDRKRDEITMHPDSRRRKIREARKGKMNAYTVVLDKRPGQENIYWQKGVGNFTLVSMHSVPSYAALKKVLVAR